MHAAADCPCLFGILNQRPPFKLTTPMPHSPDSNLGPEVRCSMEQRTQSVSSTLGSASLRAQGPTLLGLRSPNNNSHPGRSATRLRKHNSGYNGIVNRIIRTLAPSTVDQTVPNTQVQTTRPTPSTLNQLLRRKEANF